MSIIRKTLSEVKPHDLLEMCRQRWPEDEQLEIKEDLPSRKGKTADSWYIEPRHVGDYARNQILEEVIALANSQGGDVIIGVVETQEKPARAQRINPLPCCADLAERLAQQARSCVDPPIPSLQARGIPTEADGSGVVIIRVARSRAGPHRHEITRECYHRVRTETQKMTMRQIQDLTFAVARGLESVEKRLSELRVEFGTWAAVDRITPMNQRLAIHVCAVPSSTDVYLERVHGVREVELSTAEFEFVARNNRSIKIFAPLPLSDWRPILRGTEAAANNGPDRVGGRLFCDGAISLMSYLDMPLQATPGSTRNYLLNPAWLFGMVAGVMDTAGRFRDFAGIPAVEYALQIEIVPSAVVPVVSLWSVWGGHDVGSLTLKSHSFPRYVIGDRESWNEVLRLIYRDFWHLVGIDTDDDLFGIPHWG